MKSWDLDNLLFEMELRVFLKKKKLERVNCFALYPLGLVSLTQCTWGWF